MNDDITRMAREAGMVVVDDQYSLLPFLQRFAALVAKKEREAMVAEAAKQGLAMKNEDPFEDYVRDIADIRARGTI